MKKYSFIAVMLAVITAVSMTLTWAYVRTNSREAESEEILIVTSFYPMYIAMMNIAGQIA